MRGVGSRAEDGAVAGSLKSLGDGRIVVTGVEGFSSVAVVGDL